MKRFVLLTALTCAMAAAASSTLHKASGSGGTLVAPNALGQKITATNISLSSGGTASMSCPITRFGAGTYQWNWTCTGGKLTVKGSVVASVSGTMKLNCSGGGHNARTTCWHTFTGTAFASGVSGPLIVTAKGAPNNAPGKVTNFSATW